MNEMSGADDFTESTRRYSLALAPSSLDLVQSFTNTKGPGGTRDMFDDPREAGIWFSGAYAGNIGELGDGESAPFPAQIEDASRLRSLRDGIDRL